MVAASVACCGATAAHAQSVGGAPYYINGLERAFVDPGISLNGEPELAGVFERGRETSVTTRPHPEYAPLGIRAGSFLIYPSVDTRLRYDSNIFADTSNRKSDGISDTTLHVEADSTWSQHALNLFADLRRREYFSSGTESNTAFRIGADGELIVDRLTPVTGSVTYHRDVEPRIAVTGILNARNPIRYDRAEARGQITHEFDRLVARGIVRYTALDYRNGEDVFGKPLPQDYRDHVEMQGGGELSYAASPAFAPFVTATYNRFDYQTSKQIVPIGRNSDGYELAAGVDFDISRLARGRVQVGYLRQNWSDPSIKPVSTVSVRARVEYFPTQLVTLSALVSRNLEDSQIPDAPSYLDTSSVARADYELLRNLILSAEAGYEVADFKGADRTDHRTTFSLGGTYLANRHVTLRTQLIHLMQRSSGTRASLDYDDNRAYVGVALAI